MGIRARYVARIVEHSSVSSQIVSDLATDLEELDDPIVDFYDDINHAVTI